MTTYNHTTTYSWTNEKSENVGYFLIIEVDRVRLDDYSLPVTKWSSGVSTYYTFEEFTQTSGAYSRVKSIFGEEVAQNVLHLVADKQNLPIIKEFEGYSTIIDDWIKKFQQNDDLLSLWKSLPHYDFVYPFDADFESWGIQSKQLNNENYEAEFYDKEWNTFICKDHQNSQFQVLQKEGSWKVYLVGNWKLIVVCNIGGEIIKLEHLKPIEEVFKGFYGEIEGIKKIDDLILISFSKYRLRPDLGAYILALNPLTGKIIYHKHR